MAATHGRSFWVLDDLTPLHQLTQEVLQSPAHVFKPRPAYRTPAPFDLGPPAPGKNYQVGLGVSATFQDMTKPSGETVRMFLDAGRNPPDGVVVNYHLKEKPEGEVTLAFLDRDGLEIRNFSSRPADDQKSTDGRTEPRVWAEKGMNRFIWNMRYPDAREVPGDGSTERSLTGPLAPPGTYQVRLRVRGESYTQSFEVRKDPRVAATQGDLEAQFALLTRIRDRLSETHDAINELRSVRRQVDEWVSRADGHSSVEAVSDAASGVKAKLDAIEEQLIQTRSASGLDRLNFHSRLNAKLADLTSVVATADAVPTRQSYEVSESLSAGIHEQIEHLRRVNDEDVSAFVELIRQLDVPAIVPRPSA